MKVIGLLFLSLVLTSCGFHWEGMHSTSEPLELNCKNITPRLCNKVQRTLLQRGYHIQPQALLKLTVHNSTFEKIMSPLKTTEKRRYYDLKYHLNYSLVKQDLKLEDTLVTEKAFEQNENQILGSESELRETQQELEDRALELLCLRLDSK